MEIPEAIALDVAEEEILFLYGEEGEFFKSSFDEDTGRWNIVFFLSSGLMTCYVSADGYNLSCEYSEGEN